jgi:hypothetical protein
VVLLAAGPSVFLMLVIEFEPYLVASSIYGITILLLFVLPAMLFIGESQERGKLE